MILFFFFGAKRPKTVGEGQGPKLAVFGWFWGPKMGIPFGNQTWRLGKWTIEIGDFSC